MTTRGMVTTDLFAAMNTGTAEMIYDTKKAHTRILAVKYLRVLSLPPEPSVEVQERTEPLNESHLVACDQSLNFYLVVAELASLVPIKPNSA